MKSEREQLYHDLIKRVSRELNQPADSEIVKHVATFRLLRESLQVRLLDGDRVDPDDLLKIDTALKSYLPQGKPLSVAIEYVSGVTGIYTCKFCGKQNRLEPGTYTSVKDRPLSSDKPMKDQPNAITSASDKSAPPAAAPTPATTAASRQLPPPPPRNNPRWSGEGDKAFAKAVDITADCPGWLKNGGPHGGGVRRGPPSNAEGQSEELASPVVLTNRET
jgi:hypothetical protein